MPDFVPILFLYYLGILLPSLKDRIKDKCMEKGSKFSIEKIKNIIEKIVKKDIWKQKVGQLKTEEWIKVFQAVLISTITELYSEWGKEEIGNFVESVIEQSLNELPQSQDILVLNRKVQSICELNVTGNKLLLGIAQLLRNLIEDQQYREEISRKTIEELIVVKSYELKQTFLISLKQLGNEIQSLKAQQQMILQEILKQPNIYETALIKFYQKFTENYFHVPKETSYTSLSSLLIEPPSIHTEIKTKIIEYVLDITKEYPLLDIIGVMVITPGGMPYYTQLYEYLNHEPELLAGLLHGIFTTFNPPVTKEKIYSPDQDIELSITSGNDTEGISSVLIQYIPTRISGVVFVRQRRKLTDTDYLEAFKGPLRGFIEELSDLCSQSISKWNGEPLLEDEQSKIHTLIVRNLRTALLFPVRYQKENWVNLKEEKLKQDIKIKSIIETKCWKSRYSLLIKDIWDVLAEEYGKRYVPNKLQDLLNAEVFIPRIPSKFFFPIKSGGIKKLTGIDKLSKLLNKTHTRDEIISIYELIKDIDKLGCTLLELPEEKADSRKIQDFYQYSFPRLDIFAADADIKREKHQEVKNLLEEPHGLSIICITGKMGNGKSTLALRTVYQLLKKGEIVLRQHTKDPRFWYFLSDFAREFNQPIYILIDDLFQNNEFVEGLVYNLSEERLSPQLPIKIIATSRWMEFEVFRDHRGIKELINVVELFFSKDEKMAFLSKIGKSYESLTSEEKQLFEQAESFFELIDLDSYAKKIVEYLKKKDKIIHKAFKYVCFSSSFGIPVPESLLTRVDHDLYKIIEREGSKKFFYTIFSPSESESLLTVGSCETRVIKHPIFSKKILMNQDYLTPPFTIFLEFIKSLDSKNTIHRRFILDLTSALIREEPDLEPDVRKILQPGSEHIEFTFVDPTIPELVSLRSIYDQLGFTSEAKKYSERIINSTPKSSADCHFLITEFSNRGEPNKILSTVEVWLEIEPEDGSILARWLSILKKIEGVESDQALKHSYKYLQNNPEDKNVRVALLSFIREKGTQRLNQKQLGKIIRDNYSWLKEHPESKIERETFLSLLGDVGSQIFDMKELKQIKNYFTRWLNDNPEDGNVRASFLVFVKRIQFFSLNDLKKLITEYLEWFNEHPSDSNVRNTFIGFIRDRGFFDAKDIQNTVDDINGYLTICGSQLTFFSNYLSLIKKIRKTKIKIRINNEIIKRLGSEFLVSCQWEDNILPILSYANYLSLERDYESACQIYRKLLDIDQHFLTQKSKEGKKVNILRSSIYFEFGMLFLSQGMNNAISLDQRIKMLRNAEEKFRKVLEFVKGHTARAYLAIALEEQGRYNESRAELKHMEWWVSVPWWRKKFWSEGKLYFEIAKFYREFNRWKKAKYWYEQAVKAEPRNFANWWGVGMTRMKFAVSKFESGFYKEAKKLFTEALSNLEMALKKAPAPLQLPASESIPSMIIECEAYLKRLSQERNIS